MGLNLADAPEAIIVTGAVVAAVGVIWRKVVIPVRGWLHDLRDWMHSIEVSVKWVEEQTRTNGGSSLVDKVNMLLEHDAERDTAGMRYGSKDTNNEGNPQ